MEIKRTETPTKGTFELLEEDEKIGKMTYSKAGEDTIIIDHTEVNIDREGQGLGRKLVIACAEFARECEVKIIPLCPYAKKVLTETSEYRDILK